MLVTTWIGAQPTNPNRNIAGKKESSHFRWHFSLKNLTLILPFARIKWLVFKIV